jgi:phosphoribosylanthranilate isomerase
VSILIKICGITDSDGADAAMQAGVDAVGFVFSPSPRRITPVQAANLASRIGDEVLKVAVFARPSATEVERVLAEFVPDLVQADHESRRAVPQSVRFLPVIHQGRATEEIPSGWFLFDSARSGTGELTDWGQAAAFAESGRLILAGGLNPGNVAEAITSVRPLGVDVSSGVERKRGMKDRSLIAAFVTAARTAEKEPASS